MNNSEFIHRPFKRLADIISSPSVGNLMSGVIVIVLGAKPKGNRTMITDNVKS